MTEAAIRTAMVSEAKPDKGGVRKGAMRGPYKRRKPVPRDTIAKIKGLLDTHAEDVMTAAINIAMDRTEDGKPANYLPRDRMSAIKLLADRISPTPTFTAIAVDEKIETLRKMLVELNGGEPLPDNPTDLEAERKKRERAERRKHRALEQAQPEAPDAAADLV